MELIVLGVTAALVVVTWLLYRVVAKLEPRQ